MTVKEQYESAIAAAKNELTKLEAEFANLPTEAHAMETTVWSVIKEFFAKL